MRLALIDTPISSTDGYMILLYQGIFIFASFLQLIGTIDFNGSKPSRTWLLSWFGLSVISIFFTYITVALDLSFFYRLIFFCLAFGFINLQTGFLFLNHFNCGGWGKYITSGTLFIIGLHALEIPFYFDDPTAKWGFLIDAGLRLFLSVGILILYCEKTHYNLTLKEQQYRLLAENATDVIYQFSFYPAPHFEYVSPSIYNLTGYSPALFYKNVQLAAKITHPDDRDKVKILRRIINPNDNKSKLLTFRIITSTGEIIWVEQSTNTFYDENNIGLVCKNDSKDKQYTMQVYSSAGKLKFSKDFNIPYTTIRMSDDYIVMYNSSQLCVLNSNGSEKYFGSVDGTVKDFFKLGWNKYLLVMDTGVNVIKLS